MKFYIQASNPRPLIPSRDDGEPSRDPEFYETLTGGIEASFPLYSEDAIVRWNYTRIHLGYYSHLDRIIPDMIRVIKELRKTPSGSSNACFGIQGFMPTWEFAWKNGAITLSWREDYISHEPSGYDINPVTIRLRQFIAEWKMPMQVCLKALLECGFKKKYPGVIAEFQAFIDTIPSTGFLYELQGTSSGYIEIETDLMTDGHFRIRTEGYTLDVLEGATPDLLDELRRAAIALKQGANEARFTSQPKHLWEIDSVTGSTDAIRLRITEMAEEGDRVVLDFTTTRKQLCEEIDELIEFYNETH